MSNKLLSILIPIYNTSKYLTNCIESICNQVLDNYEWLEIVCINDGSTDNSESIIKSLIKKYDYIDIKLFSRQNEGASSARNIGIKSANGLYIWFIDSDDYVLNGSLKLFYKHIKLNKYDLISGTLNTFSGNRINIYGNIFFNIFGYNRRSFCTSCIKKEIIIKHNINFIPNIKYGEDLLFYDMVISRITTQKKMSQTIYLYRQHANSTMHLSSINCEYISSLWTRLDIYINYQKHLKSKYILNRQNEVIRNILFYYLRKEPYSSNDIIFKLKSMKLYPYKFIWEDLYKYYYLKDTIIKYFCFLFPFSWYYKLCCKIAQQFIK